MGHLLKIMERGVSVCPGSICIDDECYLCVRETARVSFCMGRLLCLAAAGRLLFQRNDDSLSGRHMQQTAWHMVGIVIRVRDRGI